MIAKILIGIVTTVLILGGGCVLAACALIHLTATPEQDKDNENHGSE